MSKAFAELGPRPTNTVGKIKERLEGRVLKVPDANGDWREIKGVNTLRRKRGKRQSIHVIADYGQAGDLAFSEVHDAVKAVAQDIGREKRLVYPKPTNVPAFDTVATGFQIEQLGTHSKDPQGSIIYSNTAPRGGEHLGDIEWHGNDGQDFVIGILKSGIPFFAVRAGNALSFVKDDLVGLWKANVPANGTQFRSRDTFPDAIRALRGRRGRKYFGEWIDPATIPDRPALVHDQEKGTVSFPVAYKDGYGNLKTSIRLNELPDEVKSTPVLYVTNAEGETIPVYNKLAGAEVTTGQFFLTTGSSGPKDDRYVEINQLFGNAGEHLGIKELTDHTTVTLSLNAPEKETAISDEIGEQYFPRQLQPADILAAAALDAHWFGEHGVAAEDIDINRSIGIFSPEGELKGFATYEVLEDGNLPTDYTGNADYKGKVLFVQQFTTNTNYQVDNTQSDNQLLSAVEKKARDLGCNEIWEGLDKNHPFSISNNSQHDSFGFYTAQGYATDDKAELSWQPNKDISIPCTLFRKNLTELT